MENPWMRLSRFAKKMDLNFMLLTVVSLMRSLTRKKSRKINADLFIDDRNVGGFYGWGEVYQLLTESDNPLSIKRKKRFFGLFNS